MAGFAALLVACSSDDVSPQYAERVPVVLSYTTQPQVETRAAAATNLNQDYIESNKSITVRISKYNAGAYTDYEYTTGAEGALTLPSPAPYYPLDGTNVDILAYYPATAGTSFTVSNDQTTDDGYTASDLMWATPITNQPKTTGHVALNFTHKMAKIIVNATAGTAVSQVNSVTLKQVKRIVSFNLTTGATGAADGAAEDVLVVSGNATASAAGAAVIPQQEITGALLEIGVTLSNGSTGTATYSVPSGKLFSANSYYTLNITVSYPEVGGTTAITGWTEGGTAIVQPSVQQQTFDVDNNAILTFNVKGVQFQMIAVKGGSYTTFGGVDVTGTLTDYYIGQTEVTNGLWNAVMGSKPQLWSATGENDGQPNDGDSYPVCYISWDDICTASTGFLDKLNAALAGQLPDGKTFRLPSEAQWEYAARGGTAKQDYTYAGSNNIDDVAWYTDNSAVDRVWAKQTHPVATKQANSLGLYDMSGNAMEWCQDVITTVVRNQGTDFVSTSGSSDRVTRGGDFYFPVEFCGVAERTWCPPTVSAFVYGFRLVLQ